ncbi:MAG: c-type cytochrome [Planctomycetes bacterium]|nr:c-type cytochrome [Planctomycetota bacterium]MCW8135562.1 c-type cytochrome [Planctomycetota bacterium]
MQKVFDKVVDTHVGALEKAHDFVVKSNKGQPARIWIGTGALIGAIIAGVVAGYLQRDFGKRNIEYLPDMAYSKAWESQQMHHYPEWDNNPLPNPIAAWGTADMPPPEGTVYRGQKWLDIPAGPDGLAAARHLAYPYAGVSGAQKQAVLNRGQRLFKMNCMGCHGVDGVGNAPVTKYGVGAPVLANATVREKYTEGQFFHIITHGINTMPAHASHVDYDDRWKIVAYLRSLQEGK